MKKQTKQFLVNFDMKSSHDVPVSAKTIGEAKKKAWEKFKKRLNRAKFSVDVVDSY